MDMKTEAQAETDAAARPDAAVSQQGVRRSRSASNKIDRGPPRPAKKSQTDSHVSPPPRPLSPMQDSTTQNVADDGPAGATAQLNLVTGSVGLKTAAVPWDGQTLQSAIDAVSQSVPADSQSAIDAVSQPDQHPIGGNWAWQRGPHTVRPPGMPAMMPPPCSQPAATPPPTPVEKPADSQAPQENSAAASQVPAPQTPEPQPQDSAAASLGNQAEKRQIKAFLDDHPELNGDLEDATPDNFNCLHLALEDSRTLDVGADDVDGNQMFTMLDNLFATIIHRKHRNTLRHFTSTT